MCGNLENESSATLQEVARIAGVSIASVSRALNNKQGLSSATREHILAVCKQLNYSPHRAIKEIVTATSMVALSLGAQDFLSSRYTAILWPHLARALYEQQKLLVPVEQQHNESLSNYSSVILLDVKLEDTRVQVLKEKQIPFVCIGIVEDEFWIAPDDFTGGRIATEYLAEQGRNRISFVTPTRTGRGYQFRYQGYLSAMASLGLPVSELKTGQFPHAEIAAYRHFIHLPMEELMRFDGFVCECDETAIGLVMALQDRGIHVPEKISVIGFDGFLGVYEDLTTIVQDIPQIAQKTIQKLSSALAREHPTAAVLPVSLRKGQTA